MALVRKLALLLVPAGIGLAVTLYVNRPLEKIPFAYSSIPETLGGAESKDVPVTDLESGILLTNQIFGREYSGPSGSFFVSIVYYPNGDVNFHHPEGCTRAQGSLLLERGPIALEGGWPGSRGTYFQIRDPSGGVTHFAYAFCTPYRAIGDYIGFRKHLALTSLRRGRTACALIRISIRGDMPPQEAREKLQRFWRALSPYALKGFGGGGA